jgi:hypothetical protein
LQAPPSRPLLGKRCGRGRRRAASANSHRLWADGAEGLSFGTGSSECWQGPTFKCAIRQGTKTAIVSGSLAVGKRRARIPVLQRRQCDNSASDRPRLPPWIVARMQKRTLNRESMSRNCMRSLRGVECCRRQSSRCLHGEDSGLLTVACILGVGDETSAFGCWRKASITGAANCPASCSCISVRADWGGTKTAPRQFGSESESRYDSGVFAHLFPRSSCAVRGGMLFVLLLGVPPLCTCSSTWAGTEPRCLRWMPGSPTQKQGSSSCARHLSIFILQTLLDRERRSSTVPKDRRFV